MAFWRTSACHDPNDIIRSIAGSVALASHTLLVIESTANGVGNYFHTEWLRAEAGVSDKTAIFVPWYEYDIYTLPVDDYETLWNSLDPYERGLWQRGLSLEQIAWYHAKRREYTTHRAMQAEYPSTADEAFTATDRGVFDTDGIARLRTECRQPASTGEICGNAVKGREALRNVHFTADSAGRLKIWKHPEQSVSTDRYLTIVDIGGRSDTSDYSVIAVVDRHGDGNRPEIVAQWRGHTDHDLLAWNASQIATYYRKALLIVESNTIETERTEGENSGYILDEIADYYDNVLPPQRRRQHGNASRIPHQPSDQTADCQQSCGSRARRQLHRARQRRRRRASDLRAQAQRHFRRQGRPSRRHSDDPLHRTLHSPGNGSQRRMRHHSTQATILLSEKFKKISPRL